MCESPHIRHEPHLEQQQQASDLGQQSDDFDRFNPAKQARPQDDACKNLPNDRRSLQPGREFCKHASQQKDGKQKQEKRVDLHIAVSEPLLASPSVWLTPL